MRVDNNAHAKVLEQLHDAVDEIKRLRESLQIIHDHLDADWFEYWDTALNVSEIALSAPIPESIKELL